MCSLQMSQLLAWNREVAFLSSHVPLLMNAKGRFSTLAWKRGVPNLDCTNVWGFFFKAYAAIELDSKNAVDFKDHWTGTIRKNPNGWQSCSCKNLTGNIYKGLKPRRHNCRRWSVNCLQALLWAIVVEEEEPGIWLTVLGDAHVQAEAGKAFSCRNISSKLQ